MKNHSTAKSQTDPEHWVEKYDDILYSYAHFMIQDEGLAEELVQETFVAALGARKNFRGESSEKSEL